jgi:hypothetical protein
MEVPIPSLSIANLGVGCQLQALDLAGEEIDASRWHRPALRGRSPRATLVPASVWPSLASRR